MCGIFSLLNHTDNKVSKELIETSFSKGQNRGPEMSSLHYYLKLVMGFHRLAINGLNVASNQPIEIDNIILICNGEIFNYVELFALIDVEPVTNSDCEIIIHLFIKYGIEQTLNMIDGEFAFVLLDNRLNICSENTLYVARDPYGIRPLYSLTPNNAADYDLYGFTSELKSLIDIYKPISHNFTIKQFQPGTYSIYKLPNVARCTWSFCKSVTYHLPVSTNLSIPHEGDIHKIHKDIAVNLYSAVIKRITTTERPVACLLSGGLDSSLITALVNNHYKVTNPSHILETYSIGLTGSEDLKYAKIVADYLGTKHTEIIVSEQDMFNAIEEVIYAIESYDTTTVRASLGNYLIGKYISIHSDAKVILNGDGSDELCGGYLYMNKCPDPIEFDKETRRLLKDISYFDVLRSDKCISSHGLEPRTPFLDKQFVNFYLSLPLACRNHNRTQDMEKHLLRSSFDARVFQNYEKQPLLPSEILWRKKEAFSDGVTSKTKSLFQIIQENIVLNVDIKTGIEAEKYYYKQLFDKFYPNCIDTIPYYWMPKYTNATDPSARTLEHYEDEENETEKENEMEKEEKGEVGCFA
jgi:asparagine synthase (glutamine-hydrolysing)